MKTSLPRRSWRRRRGERGEHRATETACEGGVAEGKRLEMHSSSGFKTFGGLQEDVHVEELA